MKLKHNFKRINLFNLLLFSTIGLLIVGTSNTIGWFISSFKVTFNDEAFGKGLANYFKSGDGSKGNPYIISNHVHMYNLAWLQDLGYFNEDNDSDGVIDKQYYFKIENDITMPNDYILPPIGTSLYPFLGNFDGREYTITNLNISNDYSTFKRRPTVVTSDVFSTWNVNIVGTFGIIGSYPDMERITSFSESEEAINQVSGLYLDNVTINTNSSELLVGIFAGYVNGTVYDCGVHYSQIKVNQGSSKISNIDGIENSYVSNYSLVGAYNTSKYSWSDSGSWGNNNGWGGSIDISSLAKRINFIARSKTANNTTPSSYSEYKNFNASLYYYNKGFDWNSSYAYGQYVAIQSSTYLPLNIDLDKANINDEKGTYYFNSENTTEPTLSTNTGYIVGKYEKGQATPRLHNKYYESTTSSSTTNGINYSIYCSDQSKSVSTSKTNIDFNDKTYSIYEDFKPENISFFYVDNSGTSYRITDSENNSKSWSKSVTANTKDVEECGFGDLENGYYSVKKGFSKMLSDGQVESYIKNSQIILNSLQMFGPSTNEMMTNKYTDVLLNSTTYNSFEMVDGGVNFELKEKGSIKIIVGAYAASKSGSTNNSVLPAIYKVERSADNKTISSYKKITDIKENSGNYYYTYSDNTSDTTPSSAVEVCNLSKLYAGSFIQKCAYYVEIPLNGGDYWFGADDTYNMSSFILYLDIGANSDGSGSDLEDNLKNVDYVGKTNGVLDKVSSTTLSKVAFRIGDSTEAVTYYFRRVNDTVYYYSLNYSFITPSTTGTSVKSKDENCNE